VRGESEKLLALRYLKRKATQKQKGENHRNDEKILQKTNYKPSKMMVKNRRMQMNKPAQRKTFWLHAYGNHLLCCNR
jgi:hypothetical protein